MRFGHRLYNWDWNQVDQLDLRLSLTKETGWGGSEGKPEEFGVPAEELRRRSQACGVVCAASGGNPGWRVIDYAQAAGASIVRANDIPREDVPRWVEYAGERGVTIAVHKHGAPVGTREEMLAYLDACPGLAACPDTGNLLVLGSDPVKTVRDLGERCAYPHLKDTDPSAVGVGGPMALLWELGAGALGVAGAMSTLEGIGCSGWAMVERDQRVDGYAASARRMRDALRRLGY